MRSVPLFYFDPQPLRARADGRFGLEDCWQHPQVWTEKYSFAPAIMRKPSTSIELEKYEFRLLWWNPQRSDYILLRGSAFADLGKLSLQAAEPLLEIQKKISDRLRRFSEQNPIPNPVHYYEASMRSTCTRLQDCPMSFRDVVGQVTELQRICLDLLAMLDWLEIFHPLSIDETRQHHRPADYSRVGCFTSNPEVTKRLFLAGLPVWLIRFDYSLPSTIKIKGVTAYALPSRDIVVEDWHDQSGSPCPFPTLHHGKSGADHHKASCQLGRAFADIPDLEAPIDSSVGKAPTSSSHVSSSRLAPCKPAFSNFNSFVDRALADQTHTRPKKTNKKSGNNDIRDPHDNPGANRDKWQDIPCDLIPPDITVWTEALRKVDRDRKRIQPDLPNQEKGYAFPDPNSLTALPVAKQAQKLCAWLSLRAATCARVFTQAGRKAPTGSGAIWRLATDINQVEMIPDDPCYPPLTSDKKTTKAEKLRDAVRHLFGDELLSKLRGEVESVEWHEVSLQVRDHAIVDLDAKVVKEIIWELFEHNFRYEVVALDMAAAPSKWVGNQAVTRKDFISNMFGCPGKFVIWSDPFPRRNGGVQSMSMDDRMFNLEYLRRIQKDWPDVPPIIRDSGFIKPPADYERLEDLETKVVYFYCQTFFDYFGRPPIVPHRIPVHADEELRSKLQD